MKRLPKHWLAGFIGIFIILPFGYHFYSLSTPGELDGFTQCLADKQVKFYGAFWCPHCQAQKKIFGKSAKLLPYIECSNSDGKTQTQICIDQKITSYPTWEFPGEPEKQPGELTLAQLAEKTGCVLPQ